MSVRRVVMEGSWGAEAGVRRTRMYEEEFKLILEGIVAKCLHLLSSPTSNQHRVPSIQLIQLFTNLDNRDRYLSTTIAASVICVDITRGDVQALKNVYHQIDSLLNNLSLSASYLSAAW